MDFDLSLLSGLKEKDFSRSGLMALEGRILIEKALAAGVDIIGLACVDERKEEWTAASRGAFPVHPMTHAELSALVDFPFHRGAIAMARRPEILAFGAFGADRSLPAGWERGAWLCLWDVSDPSNVGALIRTAAGLGARGVLLGPGSADPYYRKALRASMGNAFSLPLYSATSETITALRSAGVVTIAATLSPEAVSLREFAPHRPLVLMVGNEGYGLPADIVGLCDSEVHIPMAGGVDSLNVVVAAAICMFELFGR